MAPLRPRTARAPASSANLGPGFDALALALGLYTEVAIAPSSSLKVHTEGEGSDLPRDREHLGVRVAAAVLGHHDFEIRVRSEIPLARGLGSSAALAVAAAAAAGADDPLWVATEFEGHPENAAASVLGGLVAASIVGARAVAHSHRLDEGLRFVVVIPEVTLSTKRARSALDPSVPHADAAFNLSRMGILLAGLADRSKLVAEAFDDRLHQGQRSALFPQAPAILQGLVDAGALGSCWSGAGPSLLAVCTEASVGDVVQAGRRLGAELGVAAEVVAIDSDRKGLVVADC